MRLKIHRIYSIYFSGGEDPGLSQKANAVTTNKSFITILQVFDNQRDNLKLLDTELQL